MSKKQKGSSQVKVALIGPMRNLPDWNYPEFNDVERSWISSHPTDIVINPASNFDGDTSRDFSEYMQASCEGVLKAQFVVLLPGWEKSEGATHEVALARVTNKLFYTAEYDGADWWFARCDAPKAPNWATPLNAVRAEIGLPSLDEGFEGMALEDCTQISVGDPDDDLAEMERELAARVRTFEGGATRDTEEGKLDFEAFLSPLVLQTYAEYMHKHRKRTNGTLRAGDDWQQGMPRSVYMKSAWRHFFEVWSLHRAGKTCPTDMADALCGVIFNAMGYLHEVELDRDLPTV